MQECFSKSDVLELFAEMQKLPCFSKSDVLELFIKCRQSNVLELFAECRIYLVSISQMWTVYKMQAVKCSWTVLFPKKN